MRISLFYGSELTLKKDGAPNRSTPLIFYGGKVYSVIRKLQKIKRGLTDSIELYPE